MLIRIYLYFTNSHSFESSVILCSDIFHFAHSFYKTLCSDPNKTHYTNQSSIAVLYELRIHCDNEAMFANNKDPPSSCQTLLIKGGAKGSVSLKVLCFDNQTTQCDHTG